MDDDDARRIALAVEGQISEAECMLLMGLARQVVHGVIVEVGSFRGRSTVSLALGSRRGSGVPVYAIEPHETFTGALGGEFGPADRVHFFLNLLRAGVVEEVRLVNLSSELVSIAWGQPIGMLWLDGDHSFEGVLRDFRCWAPHVRAGGVVAFHDSVDPALGPRRLVDSLVQTGRYQIVGTVDVTTVMQKRA